MILLSWLRWFFFPEDFSNSALGDAIAWFFILIAYGGLLLFLVIAIAGILGIPLPIGPR